MIRPWTLLSHQKTLETRVLDVYTQRTQSQDHPEKGGNFVVLDMVDWVNVIAITPEQQVVFVRQYRQGTREVTLEIPGGMVDAGEDFLTAGLRELKEEAGGVGTSAIQIGVCEPNPALQRNRCGTILVTDVELGESDWDPNEEIEVVLVPLLDVPNLFRSGAVTHSLVIAAFHWLHLHESSV